MRLISNMTLTPRWLSHHSEWKFCIKKNIFIILLIDDFSLRNIFLCFHKKSFFGAIQHFSKYVTAIKIKNWSTKRVHGSTKGLTLKTWSKSNTPTIPYPQIFVRCATEIVRPTLISSYTVLLPGYCEVVSWESLVLLGGYTYTRVLPKIQSSRSWG